MMQSLFEPDSTAQGAHDSLAFQRMFAPGRLSLGVFFPIEAFAGDRPTMANQVPLARLAEELGFAALWFRDVPLRDPSFGDTGQIFDPWVYLGYIATGRPPSCRALRNAGRDNPGPNGGRRHRARFQTMPRTSQ